MDPREIANQLRELAIYYELDGDRHRAGAYTRAAASVAQATGLQKLIEDGRLEELPNVGPSSARVVAELARRGTVAVLDQMRAKWPRVVIELAELPRIGVLKARAIHNALAPADLDEVAELARRGSLRELPGFGAATEQKILKAIEERALVSTRIILLDAQQHGTSLADHLAAAPGATRVEIAGDVRRWCEVIDTLAYAVEAADRDAVVDRLAAFALVTSVDRSRDPIVGRLADGLAVSVHVAPRARFGLALVEATGSAAHVAQLHERARARGIDLAQLDAPEEVDVYRALGLPWLPPEVRDGTDELAAADAGDDFTDLVALEDVTAAFHCHTTASDGSASIAEMARAAADLGMQAITITDHSAAAAYAGGLDLERLRAQAQEIAALADPAARLLHGTEADILADGAIDVPADMIPQLDVIIASVHQRFKLDEAATTERLIAMARAPFFKVWGHALGRLLLRREPVAVRIDDVLDAAAESKIAIEINGDPHRLDLAPEHARKAKARGIKFVLSSDAHSTRGIAAVRFAAGMARRARLRRSDVLNTRPPDELAAAIRPVAR